MSLRGARPSLCVAVVGPAVMLVVLAACSGPQTPAVARTATVSRADVTAGVSGSGSFAAVRSENLGFATGGRLTSVKVKVGDHVETGDVLAKVDSRQAEHALEQAEANLSAQQAGLERLAAATTVSGAENTVAQARTVVGATKEQAAATARADKAAISRAKAQLRTDEDAKDQAADALKTLKALCRAATAATATADSGADALAQRALQQIQAGDSAGAAQTLAQLNSQLGSTPSTGSTTACTQVITAQAAVTAAEQRVVADETAVVAAKEKKKVDAAAGRLQVANAEQAVVAAQNGLSSSSADRPHGLDQQQALVDAAQAGVDTAQKAVDDTVLVAPSDGTITVVNGSKGEYVTASTGTTAQAPGSRAAIPGSTAATGTTGASRPGGTQFMVLSDVEKVQLVLPLEQSDAATVRPGLKVTVQADAVPDAQLAGTVLSVAPSSTVSSGAVSYLATVALSEPNDKLKDGQTGRGTIITQQRANVLSVPNSAIHQQGTTSTVVLLNDDGTQQTVPIEVGAVGSDRTEVLSGLTEGQRVVLPDGAN